MQRFAQSTLVLLALSACQEPTQITIEVSTDVPCEQRPDSGISVGVLAELDGKPPASTSTKCDSATGRIGSLVAVPAGEGPSEVAFRIVTSVGGSVNDCTTPTEGDSCIVSRRALRYLDNKKLLVPVVQRSACIGVRCPVEQTCVRGECVSARVDAELCAGADGCGEDVLAGSGGAGGGGSGGAGGAGGAGGEPIDIVHDWSMRFGNALGLDRGTAVAVDAAGNAHVSTAISPDGHDFGNGDLNGMVIFSVGPNRARRWEYSEPGGILAVNDLALDSMGHSHFAGLLTAVVDLGDGPIGGDSNSDILVGSIDDVGAYGWAHGYGSPGAALANHRANSVAVGPDGNVYVLGSVGPGNVMIGQTPLTPNTLFMAVYQPDGSLIYVHPYAGTGGNAGALVIDSAGFIYVAGYFVETLALGTGLTSTNHTEDLFVAKLDTAGNVLWAASYGADAVQLFGGLVLNAAGQLVVLGSSADAINFGGGLTTPIGGMDVVVAAFATNDGSHLWSKAIGSTEADFASALAADAAGNLFIAANNGPEGALTSLASDGRQRWTARYPAVGGEITFNDLAVGASGNLFATGQFTGTVNFGGQDLTTAAGNYDGFLVKFVRP